MFYYLSGMDARYTEIFDQNLRAGAMFTPKVLQSASLYKMMNTLYDRGIPLVLDSGSFEQTLTDEEYVEMLEYIINRFTWVVMNDVIGNQWCTDDNYHGIREYLPYRKLGRVMYVVQLNPVIDKLSRVQYLNMKKLIRNGLPFIGLAIGNYCKRQQFGAVERYLDDICKKFTWEQRRYFHLLGVGNYRILHKYRNEFGSADSSAYLCATRGEMLKPEGGRMRCDDPDMSKLDLIRYNAQMLVQWSREDSQYQTLCSPLCPIGKLTYKERPKDYEPYILDSYIIKKSSPFYRTNSTRRKAYAP